MNQALMTAVIAGTASIVVAVLSHGLIVRSEARRSRTAAIEALNFRYLNPLRRQVAETAFRITEVVKPARAGGIPGMQVIDRASAVSDRQAEWFVNDGCYLASTAYLTASLFAELTRVRDTHPYVRLPAGQTDTDLAGLVLRVNLAFLTDLGIYYAVQYSIGRDMIGTDGRLKSYREFCEALTDAESRPWYARLLTWYLDLGPGRRLDQADEVVKALHELARFLDRAVGGSPSLTARFAAEAAHAVQRESA